MHWGLRGGLKLGIDPARPSAPSQYVLKLSRTHGSGSPLADALGQVSDSHSSDTISEWPRDRPRVAVYRANNDSIRRGAAQRGEAGVVEL